MKRVTATVPSEKTGLSLLLTHGAQVVLATVLLTLRSIHFGILRLAGRPVPWTFVVLMYHSVKAEDVAGFSRQMDLLKRHTCVVGADFPGTSALPGRRYSALTFDDGFESFAQNVLPVLQEKEIPATVFVATRFIGGTPGWTSDRRPRGPVERLLGEDEIKALAEEGLAVVGSHSVSHRRLSRAVLSAEEIWFELVESKRHLETMLGREVAMFALPYGAFDEEVLRAAKEAGYHRVFLSEPLGSLTNIDRHVVGRIDVEPTDPRFSFGLKVLGAYQFLPFAIAAKARISEWIKRIGRSGSGSRV